MFLTRRLAPIGIRKIGEDAAGNLFGDGRPRLLGGAVVSDGSSINRLPLLAHDRGEVGIGLAQHQE